MELVNKISEKEGLTSKDRSSSLVLPELKQEYLNKLQKSLGFNKSDFEQLLSEINSKTSVNLISGVLSNNKITNRSVEELKINIKTQTGEETPQYYLDQYLALVEYDNLKTTVKEFTKSVGASKYGESGASKSLTAYRIQANKTADVYYKNMIVNFDKKFYNTEHLEKGLTSLGTFHKNTEVLMNNLINNNPKLFITGNDFFADIMNSMSSEIHKNKKYLDDENIGKIFEQSFYTMITSESKLFKMNDETVKRGDKEIPKEFFYLFTKSNPITPVTLSDLITSTKQELLEQNRSNFLLDNLEIKEDNNFVFIGIDGLRLKPNDFTEKLINGWRELDREYPSLAEDLVKYAYQQSGFKYNANQIYQFIPHEYLVKNNFNNYLNKIADEIKEGKIDPDIIKDNIYRHNWNNSKIVPIVNIRNIAKRENGTTALYSNNVGFRLSVDSNRHSGEGYLPSGDKIKTFPKFVNYDDALYQLEGYYENEPIYFKTHKLGYRSNKGQLHEYTLYNELSESNVKENNVIDSDKEIINKFKTNLQDKLIPYVEVELEQLLVPNIRSFNTNELVSDLEVDDVEIETSTEILENNNSLFSQDELDNLDNPCK